MAKFVIEFDSSRKNINNELLPFSQFVPGVLSLKNTNQPYTLFIGELNKSAFYNTIDIFKSNAEIYKKIASMFPPSTEVPTQITITQNTPSNVPSKVNNNTKRPPLKFDRNTGQIKPYVFSNINPKFIPPTITTNFLNQVRKKAMETMNINTTVVQEPKTPSLPRIPNIIKFK